MNFDKEVRALVRAEVERAVAPLQAALDQLQAQSSVLSQLSAILGGAGAKRAAAPKAARRGGAGRKRGRRGEARGCAIIGCKNNARSKGYCSAHYQKRRNLEKTKRLPSDWKENAGAGTVKDLVLPRGRAGAKALAEARGK